MYNKNERLATRHRTTLSAQRYSASQRNSETIMRARSFAARRDFLLGVLAEHSNKGTRLPGL